jgi:hypothetical protein
MQHATDLEPPLAVLTDQWPRQCLSGSSPDHIEICIDSNVDPATAGMGTSTDTPLSRTMVAKILHSGSEAARGATLLSFDARLSL